MPSIFVTGLWVLFLLFFFFNTVALNDARKEFRIKTNAVQDQNQFRKKRKKSIIATAKIESILHRFGLERN